MDFQNEFLEEIKKSNKTVKIFLIKGVPLFMGDILWALMVLTEDKYQRGSDEQ